MNPLHSLVYSSLIKLIDDNLWEKYSRIRPEDADGYFCKAEDLVINVYEFKKEITIASFGDPTVIFYPSEEEFTTLVNNLNQVKLN